MESLVQTYLILVEQLPIVAIAWIAFLGGAIGSFMNVVVYRLPRRMSLSHPSSHCPRCNHPIRWYDNIPVLGWVFLRGRCRDCQAPIAARYPIVEAIMTCAFISLWLADIPSTPGNTNALLAATILFTWHTVAICILTCVALIDLDKQRVPGSLFTFAIVVFCLLAFLSSNMPTTTPSHAQLVAFSVFALLATACGAACGWLVNQIPNLKQQRLQPNWVNIATCGLIGLTLGPARSAVVIAAASLTASALSRLTTPNRLSNCRWAAIVTVLSWVGTAI